MARPGEFACCFVVCTRANATSFVALVALARSLRAPHSQILSLPESAVSDVLRYRSASSRFDLLLRGQQLERLLAIFSHSGVPIAEASLLPVLPNFNMRASYSPDETAAVTRSPSRESIEQEQQQQQQHLLRQHEQIQYLMNQQMLLHQQQQSLMFHSLSQQQPPLLQQATPVLDQQAMLQMQMALGALGLQEQTPAS